MKDNQPNKTKTGSHKLKESVLLPLVPFFFPQYALNQEGRIKWPRGGAVTSKIYCIHIWKHVRKKKKSTLQEKFNKNLS